MNAPWQFSPQRPLPSTAASGARRTWRARAFVPWSLSRGSRCVPCLLNSFPACPHGILLNFDIRMRRTHRVHGSAAGRLLCPDLSATAADSPGSRALTSATGPVGGDPVPVDQRLRVRHHPGPGHAHGAAVLRRRDRVRRHRSGARSPELVRQAIGTVLLPRRLLCADHRACSSYDGSPCVTNTICTEIRRATSCCRSVLHSTASRRRSRCWSPT